MMAVLPFRNLTGDSNQEYVTDGLTEEIIARLGQVDPNKVGVIARTSVMQYKYGDQPIENIGQKLGAQYVLEGALRSDANNVRITTKLIRVRDRTPLWTHEYQRAASSLIEIQEEIAVETAHAILPFLGDQKRAEAVHLTATTSQISPMHISII